MITETTPDIPPTEAQIKDTIQRLKAKLNDPDIKKPMNKPVREGFQESVAILESLRTTYEGIDRLSTVQGRAIAVLAVDYLKDASRQKILIGVPIKR